ncbi:MAG TPA: decaprenyl-phosphate phosphoribosyltransferase [Polyangia bacterium]|nr:decaprenyl-phosphate phosphoribosyltransferase [Polyangia bacterium]
MIAPALKSMRPHQWVKNLFVAAPLVFARLVGDAHAAARTAAAFGIFCLLSSTVYLVNDLVDLEKDRAHPVKCKRPLASGALSVRAGRGLAVGLGLTALGGALLLGPGIYVAAAGVAYLLLNLAYSFSFKKIAFVDVGCISAGFLLRVLGGAVAIPVEPSHWVLACTLLLSALLGFGKRAHELRVAGETGKAQRDVLGRYDLATLQRLMDILGVLTTVMYLLYTRSPHARSMFHSIALMWTVPFVAFGVFRFIWIASRKSDAESPTDSMLRDPAFMINLALYGITVLVLLYRS